MNNLLTRKERDCLIQDTNQLINSLNDEFYFDHQFVIIECININISILNKTRGE